MKKINKIIIGIYGLSFGLLSTTSCVKKKTPELAPRAYDLPELDDEVIEDLPEDTSGGVKE